MRAVWGWRSHGYASGAAGINRLGYAPDNPLFTIFSQEISARDLILLLVACSLSGKPARKSTNPLKVKRRAENTRFIIPRRYRADYAVDIIFSLDSVITAVGLSDHLLL